MTRLTVWDPGVSIGLVQADYTPTTFPIIVAKHQFEGGLEAVEEILHNGWDDNAQYEEEWVCERFRPTPRVYKAPDIEALRVEGAIHCFNTDLTWQYNDQMLIGGIHGDRSKNKIAADNVLRVMGLWTTGKQIGMKDANDVNSAMKHLVAYLRNHGHEPTLEALGVR